MINSKRGVSQVIATVLILLLTITTVSVLAVYIVPYVKNNLYESTACVNYRTYFTFEEYSPSQKINIGYSCYDQTDQLTGISVRAKHDNSSIEEVSGFYLSFISEGTSKAIKIEKDSPSKEGVEGLWMLQGTAKQYNANSLEIPQNGEVRTYIYNDPVIYEVVEISPILKSGKTCPVSDNIKLINCDIP